MNKEEFLSRFKQIIDDTWMLFQEKNKQYGTEDPFANFRAGAALTTHFVNYPAMYKTLKDYMLKHVAHVYNNDIDGQKIRESLGDIVVYSIIGMVMVDEWKGLYVYGEGQNGQNEEKPMDAASALRYACDMSNGKDSTCIEIMFPPDVVNGMKEEEFIKKCKEVFHKIKADIEVKK